MNLIAFVLRKSISKELPSSLIAEAETKCRELPKNLEAAQAACDEGQAVMASPNTHLTGGNVRHSQHRGKENDRELFDKAGRGIP